MPEKMDTDGKGYVRDDTLNTSINKLVLGTAYHDEVTGVTNTYSSGTCQVVLGAACKHLFINVDGANDYVFGVMDSSSASGELTGTTTRFKFKGEVSGNTTTLSLGTAVTTLDFLKRNSGTIKVYIDGFT